MRFGIPNIGFSRLIARLKGRPAAFGNGVTKEAIKYTDDWESEWEEEYGEDWSSEDYATPDPALGETKEISQEDFVKGELILAGMGYDVENMSEDEIASLIYVNDHILNLIPQFNVQGTWVHSLKQTDTDELEEAIINISNLSREICVTDINSQEFWDFTTNDRIFAIVLQGTCKVLWNADMYSNVSTDDQSTYSSVFLAGSYLSHINEMTEGWLVPAESTLIGLKVNWKVITKNKDNNYISEIYNEIKYITENLGISLIEDNISDEKIFQGITVIDFEKAQQYTECDIDVENPEHLFEEVPGTDILYDEYYFNQFKKFLIKRDTEGVLELLNSGFKIPIETIAYPAYSTSFLELDLPPDIFKEIMTSFLQANPKITEEFFEDSLINKHFDKAELLLDIGLKIPNLNTELLEGAPDSLIKKLNY